jgi:hypothetical protein
MDCISTGNNDGCGVCCSQTWGGWAGQGGAARIAMPQQQQWCPVRLSARRTSSSSSSKHWQLAEAVSGAYTVKPLIIAAQSAQSADLNISEPVCVGVVCCRCCRVVVTRRPCSGETGPTMGPTCCCCHQKTWHTSRCRVRPWLQDWMFTVGACGYTTAIGLHKGCCIGT